jgi:hypothetical protein
MTAAARLPLHRSWGSSGFFAQDILLRRFLLESIGSLRSPPGTKEGPVNDGFMLERRKLNIYVTEPGVCLHRITHRHIIKK